MTDKITEAVLALCGVLPQELDWGSDEDVDGTYYSHAESEDIMLSKGPSVGADYICTKEEFLQRSKELGFVGQTGYRWGVEYETNGKKPELPDDVKVSAQFMNDWKDYGGEHNAVKNWAWEYSQTFRIIDERYKPTANLVAEGIAVCEKIEEKLKQVDKTMSQKGVKFNESQKGLIKEMASNLGESVGNLKWFNEEAGVGVSYPPAGTKCEVKYCGEGWKETYIVGFDSRGDAVFETPWGEEVCYDSFEKGCRFFRPLGWDEERKVEAKAKAIGNSLNSTGGYKVFTIAEMNLLKLLVREGKIK